MNVNNFDFFHNDDSPVITLAGITSINNFDFLKNDDTLFLSLTDASNFMPQFLRGDVFSLMIINGQLVGFQV